LTCKEINGSWFCLNKPVEARGNGLSYV